MDNNEISQDVLNCLDNVLARRKRGLRIDPSSMSAAGDLIAALGERAKSEIALQIGRIPKERQKPVYLYFSEDLTYGAVAIQDTYSFIVLHAGTVPALVDFCRRMMATTDLWLDIKGITNITNSTTPFSVSSINIRACEAWSVLPARIPTDPICDAFALVFVCECLDFIVRHELAHLVLGHCNFLKDGQGITYMEDTDGRLPDATEPAVIQTLEVAADRHAIIWGFEKLAHVHKTFGKLPEPVDTALRHFYRTDDAALLNYLLAIFFVFRLFDEKAWNTQTLLSRRHPPAPFRFHVACIHLMEHIEKTGDKVKLERFQRVMSVAWDLGEFIFAKTLDRLPDLSSKNQTLDKESEKHFALLHEQYQKLPSHLFELRF